MEKTCLYAYISFAGQEGVDDFQVERVTEILGVKPTKVLRIGERINDLHTRSFTAWHYESDTIETLDVDDGLWPILETFQDKIEAIQLVKETLQLNTIIRLVMNIVDGQTPGFAISPPFSQFAVAINAYLDVDMYVYLFREPQQ